MIFLAPAIYRSLNVRTATCLFSALSSAPLGEQVVFQPLWGDASVTRARSILATKFMKENPEADVMVMVDDDVIFDAADLWRIVAGARETRGIYAGAYVTHPATAAESPHIACRTFAGQANPTFGPDAPVMEVEYVAAGFMAVHRDVFAAMLDGTYRDADGEHKLHYCQRGSDKTQFWPFFDTMTIEEVPGTFNWLSEDWAFCERARQLNYHVYLDPTIMLEHMSTVGLTVNDIHSGTGTSKTVYAQQLPKTGVPLLDKLPEDLAEFGGESLDAIIAALPHGAEALAALWNTKPEAQTEEEFYKRDDVGAAYALDLTWWQLHGGGMPLTYATPEARGLKMLDFGAGIGTAALAMAVHGAKVTVAEINPFLTEFILYRAKKYGLNIDVLSPDTINVEQYQTIICWHVFEHVTNPNGLLDLLMGNLGLGETFITQSDFHIDGAHPMHHEYDGDWAAQLRRAGLVKQHENIYSLMLVAV